LCADQPQLYPSFRANYPALEIGSCDDGVLRFAYVELGGEVIDIKRICHALSDQVTYLCCVGGGHHRVAYLNKMDELVNRALAKAVGHECRADA
jgi:hypothetical protein